MCSSEAKRQLVDCNLKTSMSHFEDGFVAPWYIYAYSMCSGSRAVLTGTQR